MLLRSLGVGDSWIIILQQLLISWVKNNIVDVVVHLRVDQVNGDPQVVLGQQLVLVVSLETSGVVGDEALRVEGVSQELWIEGNVWQSVAVLDSADQV